MAEVGAGNAKRQKVGGVLMVTTARRI